MRQRLGIAQAIAGDPRLIIVDFFQIRCLRRTW
jgi:ABC-type taurine transport system ATPase subunit